MAKPNDLPARRNQAQHAIRKADVPVRLGTGGDGGGVIRAVDPDRVDREKCSNQHDHTEHDEEESASLRREHRQDRHADDVVVGAPGAGELGVLVDDHEQEVHAERGDQNRRQQENVYREEDWDDRRSRKLTTEQQVGGPGAYHRNALDETVDDAKAVAGEQVIRKRVAGEALGHREDEENEADEPVDLTRLAEGTREEDAQHVQADGGNK